MTQRVRRSVVVVLIVAAVSVATIGLLQSVGILRDYLPARLTTPNRTFTDPSHRQIALDYLGSNEYVTAVVPWQNPEVAELAQFECCQDIVVPGTTEVLEEQVGSTPGWMRARAKRRTDSAGVSQAPGGRYIAYIHSQAGITYLNRIDMETAQVAELLALSEGDIGQPHISDDGQTVVARTTGPNQSQTWWFDLKSEEKQAIGVLEPQRITPDGRKVLFFEKVDAEPSVIANDVAIWSASTNKTADLKILTWELDDIWYREEPSAIAQGEGVLQERLQIHGADFVDATGRFLLISVNRPLPTYDDLRRGQTFRKSQYPEGSYSYVYDADVLLWHPVDPQNQDEIQSIINNTGVNFCGNEAVESQEQCDDGLAVRVASEANLLRPTAEIPSNAITWTPRDIGSFDFSQTQDWQITGASSRTAAITDPGAANDTSFLYIAPGSRQTTGRYANYFEISDLPQALTEIGKVDLKVTFRPLSRTTEPADVVTRTLPLYDWTTGPRVPPSLSEISKEVLNRSYLKLVLLAWPNGEHHSLLAEIIDPVASQASNHGVFIGHAALNSDGPYNTAATNQLEIYSVELIAYERTCTSTCQFGSSCVDGSCGTGPAAQKLFVTSDVFSGSLNPTFNAELRDAINATGLVSTERADALCNMVAINAGHTTYDSLPSDSQAYEWRALLSTSGAGVQQAGDIIANTAKQFRQAAGLINGPIVNVRGENLTDAPPQGVAGSTIFTTLSEAFQGGPNSPGYQHITDERGNILAGESDDRVWTGSNRLGQSTLATGDCNAWTTNELEARGDAGVINGADHNWFTLFNNPAPCQIRARLYCISDSGAGSVVIPSPGIEPEPSQLPALCGDGRINQGEQCDDGNTLGGDGCSGQCRHEPISETHQKIFVTSDAYHGNMNIPGEVVPSNVSGANRADAICNVHASRAGLTTFDQLPETTAEYEWVALLSTPGQNARNNVELPVYNINRAKLANTRDELWDTRPSASRSILTETGGVLSSVDVWTGSDEEGYASTFTCDSWTSGGWTSAGNIGDLGGAGGRWFKKRQTLPSFQTCNSAGHLYCVSRAGFTVPDDDDTTVTPSPSPSPAPDTGLHNTALPADINGDGLVNAVDLWLLVTEIRANGEGPIAPAATAPPYLDVNNDQSVTQADIDAFMEAVPSANERAEFVLDRDADETVSVTESLQSINEAVTSLGTVDPLYNISRSEAGGDPVLGDVILLLRTANQQLLNP